MGLPPASCELLPLEEIDNFYYFWPYFEKVVASDTYLENAKKAEKCALKEFKDYERLTRFGLDPHYLSSMNTHLYKKQEEVRCYELAYEIIAKRLSWLDWFKSLNYDEMQNEIARLEGRDKGPLWARLVIWASLD